MSSPSYSVQLIHMAEIHLHLYGVINIYIKLVYRLYGRVLQIKVLDRDIIEKVGIYHVCTQDVFILP